MLRKSTITLLAVALSGISIAAVSAAGSSADTHQTSSVLYSSLVSPYSATNPPNEWWSLSFGGTNATQFGAKINLASPSRLSGATVMLDSQACESGSGASCSTTPGATFSVPITFNIYQPGATGGSVGALLATQTKTFHVPYRPSADATACAATTSSIFPGFSNDGTQWFNPATGSCYFGVVYAANFNFNDRQNLPATVVYGISYIATSGPASSLNVLLSTESSSGAVTVGSDTDPGNLFVAAGSTSNALGGASGQITCSAVGTSFQEYNTAVGATGCGTDTQQGGGAPFEPIAFVPAVELDGGN
ncbi:MAG TPA: hypothetical protein VMV12_01550 [Candidatus Micrarchaeaceae archaeon]|nr:hypothetical protein [Candidatus Micrarchaeaceae archaeon]